MFQHRTNLMMSCQWHQLTRDKVLRFLILIWSWCRSAKTLVQCSKQALGWYGWKILCPERVADIVPVVVWVEQA